MYIYIYIDLGCSHQPVHPTPQVLHENEELRKWQKRVGSIREWMVYSTKKPDKLRARIRQVF